MNISKHTTQCDDENVTPSDSESSTLQPEIAAYIKCPSNNHIFDVNWIPTFPTKFICVGTTTSIKSSGSIEIYQLNKDQLDIEKVVEKKGAFRCCSTVDAIVRNTSIALGNFHGGLQIFDVERFDFPIYDVYAHNGIVNCLDGIGGDNGAAEIVTGGQDGCIKVWDPRQRTAVVSISPVSEKENGNGPRDCWSVTFANAFSQTDRDIFAGFDNGDIKVIDLRMMKERWGCNVGSGVCKVCCDKRNEKTNKLVAGTADGSIHVFDMENKQFDNKCGSYSHKSSSSAAIWSLSHLPQNDKIFAACNGGSVEIWQHTHPSSSISNQTPQREEEPIRLLTKTNVSSESAINCFDWNPHFRGLGLCASFDQTIHILVAADV